MGGVGGVPQLETQERKNAVSLGAGREALETFSRVETLARARFPGPVARGLKGSLSLSPSLPLSLPLSLFLSFSLSFR